jgi:hypothetical protein
MQPVVVEDDAKHSKLIDLGLKPHFLSHSLLDLLMNIAVKYRDRIDLYLIQLNVSRRRSRNEIRRKERAWRYSDSLHEGV